MAKTKQKQGKRMKTITKVILSGLTALALTACGSSSDGDSAQDKAIDKIANYAQNGGTVPTLQDYIDAGVTGITNVDEINAVIENLTKEDVDTKAEIQALANKLGVEITGNIPPIAKAGAPYTTVVEGGTVSFSSRHSTDTDGTIVGYKWTEDGVGLAKVPSFTKSDFSVGTHTVTLTVTDNDGATDTDTLTIIVKSLPKPAPAPVRTPKVQTCIQSAGYETVELSNGQIWLDRDLGAPAVGELGTYFTYEESLTACPCGFVIPTYDDIWSGFFRVDYSTLRFPNELAIHWMTSPSLSSIYGYFTTMNEVLNSTSYGSGNPSSINIGVRCIDPSTQIAPR